MQNTATNKYFITNFREKIGCIKNKKVYNLMVAIHIKLFSGVNIANEQRQTVTYFLHDQIPY